MKQGESASGNHYIDAYCHGDSDHEITVDANRWRSQIDLMAHNHGTRADRKAEDERNVLDGLLVLH